MPEPAEVTLRKCVASQTRQIILQASRRRSVPVDPQPFVRFVAGLPPVAEVGCAQRRAACAQQVWLHDMTSRACFEETVCGSGACRIYSKEECPHVTLRSSDVCIVLY